MDNNLFSTQNLKARLTKELSNPDCDANEIKHLKLMYTDSLNHSASKKMSSDGKINDLSDDVDYISHQNIPTIENPKETTKSQSSFPTMNWSQHKDKIQKLINERKTMLHDDIVDTSSQNKSNNTTATEK